MRKHYYADVPGLGNVSVSRHAQEKMDSDGISHEDFEVALLEPLRPDIPEAGGILYRERNGLRIVILERPTPFRGAKLVKTAYRIIAQERAVR